MLTDEEMDEQGRWHDAQREATQSHEEARYAQQDERDTCRVCGRVIELCCVGYLYPTDEPFFRFRWVAVRRSKNAPIPIDCPAAPREGMYHEAERFDINGKPRNRDEK